MLALVALAQPLLLAALSLGLGLGVERCTRARVPGALVLPLGFAALVVVSELATNTAAAPATPWLLVVLAVAGALTGRVRLRALRAVDVLPGLASALAVYLVACAPVLFSGHVGFAAYGVDTTAAFHWLGADHLIDHGHSFPDHTSSSSAVIAARYFAGAYPAGGTAAFGATTRLIGAELPWAWPFFLAFVQALLAPVLLVLVHGLVRGRWAALLAALAAVPALLYAFALQGEIKEVCGALFLALTAACVWQLAATVREGVRATVPLALAGAAGIAVTGIGFGLWLAPAAAIALVIAWRAHHGSGRRLLLAQAGLFAGLSIVLALPSVGHLGGYLSSVNNLLTKEPPLGSLVRPLSVFQAGGIWLQGDYRLPVSGVGAENTALIAVLVAAAAASLLWMILRRRRSAALGYVAIALPGALVLAWRGTPWTTAKAMVLVSPAVLLTALLAARALWASRARAIGVVAVAIVALGVLASDALLYHQTRLAPSARYRELASIGERFAGQGPVLRPDFDDYALWFLRRMRPQGAGDFHPPTPLVPAPGVSSGYGISLRLDQLAPAYVERFPLVLVQRSPFESRPPANYRLAWSGRYYALWRRGPGMVLAHLPVGSLWHPTGRPSCGEVRGLARLAARAGARIAVSEPAATLIAGVEHAPHPRGWFVGADGSGLLRTRGPGSVTVTVRVPYPGQWSVWLAGSFSRAVAVRVDGRLVGRVADELDYPGFARELGRIGLRAGRARIEIARGGVTLAPGDGSPAYIGPVALVPARASQSGSTTLLAPARYRAACVSGIDWVEALR